MAASSSQTQWYLAREGQQFGPLSEAELAKFIELGHLAPNDLLWREGFSEWRPAMVVFPPQRPAPAPPPPRPAPARAPAAFPANGAHSFGDAQQARASSAAEHALRAKQQAPTRASVVAPAPQGADIDDAEGGERHSRRERRPRRPGAFRRAFLRLVMLGLIGGAGWLGFVHRQEVIEFANTFSPLGGSSGLQVADRKSLEVPPFKGLAGSAETVDAALQETALWRVIKREFPDWYGERMKQAAALAGQNKDDTAIAQEFARALVQLRRQHLNNALSASVPRLKLVAETFYQNLVQLRKESDAACFEFISQGEASPIVISMLQGSPHTAHLQAQLTAVYEAISEGRKSPRAYPQPRKEDYDALAADLVKRGWSQGDLQLFSDERALAQAGPKKVCQMVHDWFAAQLGLKDADAQLRLLVDSLKPVVAG